MKDLGDDVTLTSPVLNVPVGIVTMKDVIQQVDAWVASVGQARLVTFTNVHMVVEAQLRPRFREVLEKMDLNCPDGAPIFWLARRRYGKRVAKIAGPEFMPLFCEQSVALGHRHFLYGGAPGVAEEASQALALLYPGIRVVGHFCPPFRKLTGQELDEVAETINKSGADVVWVCLGCPKQEQWMSDMRDRLHAKVVLAVGQAFDILAGRTRRSPAFVSRLGLEWLYRFFQEPRRLWKRYLVTNLLFLCLLLRERLGHTQPWGLLTKYAEE